MQACKHATNVWMYVHRAGMCRCVLIQCYVGNEIHTMEHMTHACTGDVCMHTWCMHTCLICCTLVHTHELSQTWTNKLASNNVLKRTWTAQNFKKNTRNLYETWTWTATMLRKKWKFLKKLKEIEKCQKNKKNEKNENNWKKRQNS